MRSGGKPEGSRATSEVLLRLPKPRSQLRKTRAALLAWRSLTGSIMQNRLPVPSLLSTQICPLCISTIALAIDRPRPIPPWRRVRWDST